MWNSNLRSKMLRLMLRRVLNHSHITDPSLKQGAFDKITALANAAIVPVGEIRSKFILTYFLLLTRLRLLLTTYYLLLTTDYTTHYL